MWVKYLPNEILIIIHLLFLCCFNTRTDSVPSQLNLTPELHNTTEKTTKNMFLVEGSEAENKNKNKVIF